ncbi:MAG: hypothetical protein IPN06_13860 [Burkholderiales bacterium]|nr:hypothetical protein [Burkholderiales bacterium]
MNSNITRNTANAGHSGLDKKKANAATALSEKIKANTMGTPYPIDIPII